MELEKAYNRRLARERGAIEDAMQAVGCREAKLTTLHGAGHGIMHEVYPKPEIYQWLLKKKK